MKSHFYQGLAEENLIVIYFYVFLYNLVAVYHSRPPFSNLNQSNKPWTFSSNDWFHSVSFIQTGKFITDLYKL